MATSKSTDNYYMVRFWYSNLNRSIACLQSQRKISHCDFVHSEDTYLNMSSNLLIIKNKFQKLLSSEVTTAPHLMLCIIELRSFRKMSQLSLRCWNAGSAFLLAFDIINVCFIIAVSTDPNDFTLRRLEIEVL